MTTITIHIEDLTPEAQERLQQAVQKELLQDGTIEPQQEDEPDEVFEERVQEVVGDYLNRHNVANPFSC